MKCEQVEELLSAYLDGTLALGEAAAVAAIIQQDIVDHLRGCVHCSRMLAEYRRFDTLLARLPRFSPDAALRLRLFSSSEYLGLTGTYGVSETHTVPMPTVRYTRPGRPPLVALPGGRSSSSSASTTPRLSAVPSTQQMTRPIPARRKVSSRKAIALRLAIVAVTLVMLGAGSLLGWTFWTSHTAAPQAAGFLTPPAGMPERVPLSEGMRYVFARNGSLWSAPAAGDAAAQQLTPAGIEVAGGWAVSPAQPGRFAGDMLAYIDVQQARLHVVRSDGLNDTVVPQLLLKPGSDPVSVWDTAIGSAIVNSLTWSNDGTMLAFVADPQGTGAASLYIYSVQSNSVQHIPLPGMESVSQPVWSPDSSRIAFVLAHQGRQSIVDYNLQNHGELIIDSHTAAGGDSVLSLNWSPSVTDPAITWSTGVIGHVRGIWVQHIGRGWTPAPQQLMSGDDMQAIYSAAGHGGVGSWLLVTSIAGRAADLWRIDLTAGARPVQLTQGRQVAIAQWSPDGSAIDYLDALSDGVGALHIVDVSSAADTLITAAALDNPAPAWSVDGKWLVYSAGSLTVVVTVTGRTPVAYSLPLRGHANAFAWFAGDPRRFVLSLSDGQPGLYLVDMQHHALSRVERQAANSPFVWTEVP